MSKKAEKSHRAHGPGDPEFAERIRRQGIDPDASEYVEIRVADLRVDHSGTVQRDLIPHHAAKMAKEFEPALCGMIQVSRRGDGYYILDGQHRHHGAVSKGLLSLKLHCQVWKNLTLAQEAWLFEYLNKLKLNVSAYHTFNTRLTYNDPTATGVQELLRKHKLKAAQATQGDGYVIAVSALCDIYDNKIKGVSSDTDIPKGKILDDVLTVLGSAWGMDRNAYDAVIMRGMAVFVAKYYGKLELKGFAGKLGRTSRAMDALGSIRATRNAIKAQNNVVPAIMFFKEVYNNRRSAENRLE